MADRGAQLFLGTLHLALLISVRPSYAHATFLTDNWG